MNRLLILLVTACFVSFVASATDMETRCAALPSAKCMYYDGHAILFEDWLHSIDLSESTCAGTDGISVGFSNGSLWMAHDLAITKAVVDTRVWDVNGNYMLHNLIRVDFSSSDLSKGWVYVDTDGEQYKAPDKSTGIGPWSCSAWPAEPNGAGYNAFVSLHVSGHDYCNGDFLSHERSWLICQYRDPASITRQFELKGRDIRAHDDVIIGNFTFPRRFPCAKRCGQAQPCHSFSYNEQTGDCRLQYNVWGQTYTPGNVVASDYVFYDKMYV